VAHMHYKGTGMFHSFRGLLPDNKQQKIRIQGPVGAIAWRITKFQVLPESAADENSEATVQIWREEQTLAGATTVVEVNFDADELLATALWVNSASQTEPRNFHVVFDNALFTRNIFVTNNDGQGRSLNYYIELEEVKVSKAGMAQLAVAAARRTI
jgi:hypothetical protein